MTRASLFSLDRICVIGVVNLTPDSFSDGGRFVDNECSLNLPALVERARAMVSHGADVLDLGGESTRPGATEVPANVEIDRTRPAIAALIKESLGVPLSIDTRKAEVAQSALDAGATVVNDVSGLVFDPELAQVVSAAEASLILGHMRGSPADMQQRPYYDDPLGEIVAELSTSVEHARRAGISDAKLAVDPGIGFGKRLEDNLQLIAHAAWIRDSLGLPLVLGPSRKSFLGSLTGDAVESRDTATHAACAVAAFAGADAVRVHDVAGARRAVAVGKALRASRRKELS